MLHRQSILHIVTKSILPPLLYADTGSNTDQLYFSRVQVHDPFIAFGTGKKRITVQSALEFGRIAKARSFDQVLPLEKWADRARKAYPEPQALNPEPLTLTSESDHGAREGD